MSPSAAIELMITLGEQVGATRMMVYIIVYLVRSKTNSELAQEHDFPSRRNKPLSD